MIVVVINYLNQVAVVVDESQPEDGGPTEDELNRLVADVFEENNGNDSGGGGIVTEEDNDVDEQLDPDQEAALERLAQEAMMDNDFTF